MEENTVSGTKETNRETKPGKAGKHVQGRAAWNQLKNKTSFAGDQRKQMIEKKIQKKYKHRKGQYAQLPQGSSFSLTSKNYKSQRCQFYEKGSCRKGEDCTYSHDFEVTTLQEVCKFYLTGNCHKSNCLFSHDLSSHPCKFYHISLNC